MHQAIENILADKEKVLWVMKPNVLTSIAVSVLFILILLIFTIGGSPASGDTSLSGNTMMCSANGVPINCDELEKKSMYYFIYFIYALLFISLVFKIWTVLVTEYALTQDRIIVKTGIIGADVRTIYYDKLKDMSVNVNLIDKVFKTGTVNFDTGSNLSKREASRQAFSAIEQPYEVYKFIQDHLKKTSS